MRQSPSITLESTKSTIWTSFKHMRLVKEEVVCHFDPSVNPSDTQLPDIPPLAFLFIYNICLVEHCFSAIQHKAWLDTPAM